MAEVRFLESNSVPWEWAEVICDCKEPIHRPENQKEYGHTETCGRCSKRHRWQFYKCTRCDEISDMSFDHPARRNTINRSDRGWAFGRGICWNCLVKADGPSDGKPPRYTETPRQSRSQEEIGLDKISFDFF